MAVLEKCFIGSNLTSHLIVYNHVHGRKSTAVITLSRKKDVSESENSITQQQKQPFLNIKVSNTIIPRAVVAVFGLGFIDAGYSGDWSRIGVISKETEELLKTAAFLVVPLCFFLILSFFREAEN